MPKKSKEINPFDGGWNNYSHARDLEDNELASATNVDCSIKGQISVRPPITAGAITYTFLNNALNGYNSGEGLFVYQRDYSLDFSAKGDTTIYLLHVRDDDASGNEESRIYAFTTFSSLSLNALTPIIQLNDGDDDAVSVALFNADGNIRLCNSVLATDSAKSLYTMFYGGIEKIDFDSGNSTIFSETSNNIIGKPAGGAFFTGNSSPSGTSTSAGTVNLWVKLVDSQTDDIVTFTTFATDTTYPTQFITDNIYSPAEDTTIDANSFDATHSSTDTNPQYGADTIFVARDGSGYLTGDGNKVWHPDYNGSVVADASGKKILAIYTSDDAVHTAQFQLPSDTNFIDQSLFVQIWVSPTFHQKLQADAVTIRLGNRIDAVAEDHYYEFIFPLSDLILGQWNTLECVYGNHDNAVGSPNPSVVDEYEIKTTITEEGNPYDTTWGFAYVISDIRMGTPSLGTWLGDYKFFYNWEYDDRQHSETIEFTGQADPLKIEGKILEIQTFTLKHNVTAGAFVLRETSSDSSASVRITGANIFYAEYDKLGTIKDADKRFLMNMDFGKGVRKTLFDDYIPFDTGTPPTAGKFHPPLTISDPTSIDSFATVAGYSEGDKLNHVRFGSAIHLNNRSYVGNVAVMDKNDKIITYADRVYKSVSGQPDVYTKYDYLEVAPNDGESITALASYGDYLLEFKTYNMHLINITQDAEYLEESYSFRGVHDDHAVANVGAGVCWANNFGLFLFDGKEVKNLLGIKIDRDWWNINATNPIVAYDPIKDEILVLLKKAGGSAIRYSFAKENFVYIRSSSNTDFGVKTNPITEPSGQIVFVGNGGGGTQTLIYHRFAGTGSNYVDIKTIDDALDDPGRQKSLKKVYVNYKSNSATVPAIKYRKDSGAEKSFDTAFASTSDVYTTTAFKPSTSAEANNGYSFQICIYGASDQTFVVNDISLIYREKSVK